jgi:hypothetical protein
LTRCAGEEAVTVPLRVFVEGFSRHITTFTLPAAHTLADARKSFASSKYLPNHYAFLKSKVRLMCAGDVCAVTEWV